MLLQRSLAALSVLSGCLQPTQMKIEFFVESPLSCDEGDLIVSDLAVFTGRGAVALDDVNLIAEESTCAANSFGSLVFVPVGSDDVDAPIRVVGLAQVSLPDGKSDRKKCVAQILAAREGTSTCIAPLDAKPGDEACEPCISTSASFRFIEHTPLTFRMSLTAECRGVFCKAGQTCGRAGTCVDDDVVCRGSDCAIDAQGGSGGGPSGGAGGAGGSGGAGASGGAGDWTRVVGIDGVVNDLAMTVVESDGITFVAAEKGFFRCSSLPNQCTSLSNGRFDRVDAALDVAYALESSATPPNVDSHVFSSSGDTWTLDGCNEGAHDIAYRETLEPVVLNSLLGISQLDFFQTLNCSMIPSNMTECRWVNALPGSRYVAACAGQMVVFQSNQAIFSSAAPTLTPTSMSSVPVAMGDRHFVCSGALGVFNSFATTIAPQTLNLAPPCTHVSALSHDRVFLYDKPGQTLTSFPLDTVNKLDVAAPTRIAIPPNLNVTTMAASSAGVTLGTDDGLYFLALP